MLIMWIYDVGYGGGVEKLEPNVGYGKTDGLVNIFL